MWVNFKIDGVEHKADLTNPIDISIPLRSGVENPNVWYVNPPKIEAVELEDWVGAVSEGSAVNFNKITFNPHSHGTHTECVGHITERKISIQDCLKTYFFSAELITIAPKKIDGDLQITKDQLEEYDEELSLIDALVLRTNPNTDDKLSQHYNNTNWAYLTKEAALYLVEKNIKHLLIDLPSIDKERDHGKLEAHKAFWSYPDNTRKESTITELIYVPNKVVDGTYILNLQMASFVNDAAPSKPILYALNNL